MVLFSFYIIYVICLFLCAAPNAFVETLRERMFKPTLSTIVMENAKYAGFVMEI